MSAEYDIVLDWTRGIVVHIRFESSRSEIVNYAVVLTIAHAGGRAAVRVYDGAHGFNEMHRYHQSGGKETGVPFHAGTLGEGFRAAVNDVRLGYEEMIDGWRR